MRLVLALSAALFTALSTTQTAQGQITVFADNFNTDQGTAYTTSGSIGSSPWSVTRGGSNGGVDWGTRINGGTLTVTNDATVTANAIGWAYASTSTSSFSSPFSPTLSSNTGVVTWTFNMQQSRAEPSGFDATNRYGVAYVLGGTSETGANTGQGYAVVLGQDGTEDAIRLVSFNSGLQGTMANVIAATTPPFNDLGANYLSLRVTYDPSANQWSLFGRDDGATAFADPTTGSLTSLGGGTDSTFTNISLSSTGGYWQGNTAANQNANFDNVRVTVAPVPEPATVLGIAAAGLGAIGVVRRVRRKLLA